MWNSIKKFFRAYFVTGLLVLGPLLICVIIVKFIIDMADSTLQISRWMPIHIPGLGFIIAIAVILLVGFFARNVFGGYVFGGAGDIIAKIPFVGAIYSSTRQVFETLLGDQNKNFGRVVLVEYPHSQSWTLAFVTSEKLPNEVQKNFKEKMISVYVPTTPNPTSGFYIYVPDSRALKTDFSVEEAFKIIVSLGLANPKVVAPLSEPDGH